MYSPLNLLLSLFLAAPSSADTIPTGLTWLWDLEGGHTTGNADIIDYDPKLGDARRRGEMVFRGNAKHVICYFSAGTWEASRPDMKGLKMGEDIGSVLKGGNSKGGTWDDNGQPERILNWQSPRVQEVMRGRLDDAATRGCDAVEPDNVDVVSNRKAYMQWLSDEARKRNLKLGKKLGIGLKNADSDAASVVGLFDFVIVEQCAQYDECYKYDAFSKSGKAVLRAEYRGYSQSMCDDAKKKHQSLTFFPPSQNVKNGQPCK